MASPSTTKWPSLVVATASARTSRASGSRTASRGTTCVVIRSCFASSLAMGGEYVIRFCHSTYERFGGRAAMSDSREISCPKCRSVIRLDEFLLAPIRAQVIDELQPELARQAAEHIEADLDLLRRRTGDLELENRQL